MVALWTMLRRARGGSDVDRWRRVENLHTSWDARTKVLASWVAPGASVLEFGAGRRTLETLLPADCRYTPSDLVDRGPGTIVVDLNATPLPEFPPHDVCVFSGVLEYVNDVPRLAHHLRQVCGVIVASYAPRRDRSVAELIERRRQGWVNDYTIEELLAVFEQEGFRCVLSQDHGTQRLVQLQRDAAQARSDARS